MVIRSKWRVSGVWARPSELPNAQRQDAVCSLDVRSTASLGLAPLPWSMVISHPLPMRYAYMWNDACERERQTELQLDGRLMERVGLWLCAVPVAPTPLVCAATRLPSLLLHYLEG